MPGGYLNPHFAIRRTAFYNNLYAQLPGLSHEGLATPALPVGAARVGRGKCKAEGLRRGGGRRGSQRVCRLGEPAGVRKSSGRGRSAGDRYRRFANLQVHWVRDGSVGTAAGGNAGPVHNGADARRAEYGGATGRRI